MRKNVFLTWSAMGYSQQMPFQATAQQNGDNFRSQLLQPAGGYKCVSAAELCNRNKKLMKIQIIIFEIFNLDWTDLRCQKNADLS